MGFGYFHWHINPTMTNKIGVPVSYPLLSLNPSHHCFLNILKTIETQTNKQKLSLADT